MNQQSKNELEFSAIATLNSLAVTSPRMLAEILNHRVIVDEFYPGISQRINDTQSVAGAMSIINLLLGTKIACHFDTVTNRVVRFESLDTPLVDGKELPDLPQVKHGEEYNSVMFKHLRGMTKTFAHIDDSGFVEDNGQSDVALSATIDHEDKRILRESEELLGLADEPQGTFLDEFEPPQPRNEAQSHTFKRVYGVGEESPFIPTPSNAKLQFPERTVAVRGSFAIVVDDGCYVLKNLMDDADGGHWKASPYWFEDALKVLADLPRNPREATFMRSQNQTYFHTVEELVSLGSSPLPLEVIPNHMGINLCSVEGIGWEKQDDGQLVALTIHFIPATQDEIDAQSPAAGEQILGDNTYAKEEERESNSVRHAKREFLALGYKPIEECEEDPNKWVQQNVLELLEVFAKQGHSGFSAPWVISMFSKLANHEPLCPLTGEDHEWNDTTEYGSSRTSFQNLRCSHVFKDGDGRAYDIYGIVFEHAPGTKHAGSCYGGSTTIDGIKYSSHVDVVFPYTPVKKTVLVDDEGTPLDHAETVAKMNAGVDATPSDAVDVMVASSNL